MEALKFQFGGRELKMYFRYPDRKKARISDEQKRIQKEEEEQIRLKREIVLEAIKAIENVSPDEISISFKKTEFPIAKGTGPITTELHLVYKEGEDSEGKGIYKDAWQPAKTRFHTSSVRNSYEKARQYALHNFFTINGLNRGSEIYDKIIESYESRGENVMPFCHEIEDIEKIGVLTNSVNTELEPDEIEKA